MKSHDTNYSSQPGSEFALKERVVEENGGERSRTGHTEIQAVFRM